MNQVIKRVVVATAMVSVPVGAALAWADTPTQAQAQGQGQSASPSQAAAPVSAQGQQAPAIDPAAETAMRRMSNYLTSLPSFRVDTDAADEVVTSQGEKIQQLSETRVAVRRPNAVRTERVGPEADTVFRYDGRMVSIIGARNGYYATAPAPATIDETVDVLRARLGLDIPGADLLSRDPYAAMMENVHEGRYIGREPVAGVPTHHLAFRGDDVDWQIWIQDGAQPLPRRFVITSKTEAGKPQFTVDLNNWDTRANLRDADFAFTPPPGATRVQLLPESPNPSREGQR